MSSAAESLATLSFDRYLEAEASAVRRSEFVGGRVYAMAGGSERHDLAAGLVFAVLAPGALARGCRPFTANRLVRLANAAYYPDVLVVCGPAGHRLYETSVTVVVEVLSPSTQDSDRREKTTAYASCPDLAAYLLLDPDRRRVEVGRPAGDDGLTWTVAGPGDVIPTPVGDLEVDDVYDQLDRAAST